MFQINTRVGLPVRKARDPGQKCMQYYKDREKSICSVYFSTFYANIQASLLMWKISAT